jgi:glycosyltransferase involved in cell wall biosynthesis
MSGLSVVVPSKNAFNFVSCAAAIRQHEPKARIILIDDGVELQAEAAKDLQPMMSYKGWKPFNFSRNVNQGIALSGRDDVVVMNDDALLQTPGGLSLMQAAAAEHSNIGLIGSSCNNVGNRNQFPQGIGLREEPRMVCFVCVLIPRRIINAIGMLDERFVHYGCEDDDYCLRVRRAGFGIWIHDGCFVDHHSLPSSFRGEAGAGGDYGPNLEIFKQKWGVDNWGRPA